VNDDEPMATGADVPPAPDALPTPETVRERLVVLRQRIVSAGGDPSAVTVLAVTKGHPPPVVDLARAAGLVELGENYAQELLAKARWWAEQQALGPAGADETGAAPPLWHFIGHLQRNKVRQLAAVVGVWQSVDRPELVGEIARRAPGARVLIQVNATGEPQKAGCTPAETPRLVGDARDAGLTVVGLMTVGPTDDAVDPRPGFETVRALVDRLGLTICSMGMTDDLEVAVQAGSTMVRVGTALFGPRRRVTTVGD